MRWRALSTHRRTDDLYFYATQDSSYFRGTIKEMHGRPRPCVYLAEQLAARSCGPKLSADGPPSLRRRVPGALGRLRQRALTASKQCDFHPCPKRLIFIPLTERPGTSWCEKGAASGIAFAGVRAVGGTIRGAWQSCSRE